MHYPLTLIKPSFDDPITDLIIDLDHLRRKQLGGTTHPSVFFQLKHLFHILESIGSARIEGNNTTIAEYVEETLGDTSLSHMPSVIEIRNLEEAMTFIDAYVHDRPFDRQFIRELHQLVVKGLKAPPQGEGDHTPGQFRNHIVRIEKANHTPPDPLLITDYVDELMTFINQSDSPKYDLLKIALAHHRFMWIHPFGNGNGRTGRLFTYAMLVRSGFNVEVGRILNPTAVFCNNRNAYYHFLSEADTGQVEGLLRWCDYVLRGLRDEIEKIDRLLDYSYLKAEILVPALKDALEMKYITQADYRILTKIVNSPNQQIQAADVAEFFPGKQAAELSRQLRYLREKKLIQSDEIAKRKYTIRFDNNYLLRSVMKMLGSKGFLPVRD
ncbi:Fic family protein [Fibrella sp. WM1]|uniref:Fic family protein n=1 Tax=Fibrella musci TaxID=3242485 RepID=UPI0035213C80